MRVARARLVAIACAGLFVAGTAAGQSLPDGEIVIDPDVLRDKGARTPHAVLSAGNDVYTLFIADAGQTTCGTWTAATGFLHEVGSGRNVLYGGEFGSPGTSDSTLWSWSSNRGYRTGSNGGGCFLLCQMDTPIAQEIRTSGVRTGWRLTWRFTDAGNTVEFVQEVNVEGPVNGTQTVDNTSIRETHVVRNLGPGDFRFGLRKHWDWQIAGDDGPWFATCDHVEDACDRSMAFFESGGGAGVYPPNYVMNEDPASSLCPSGITPTDTNGCTGNPVYIVAGTVAPPSALVPPPTPPELLQFNSWVTLVNDCWLPGLNDAAVCGSFGSPGDDTAIAYFYGRSSATAEVLAPGAEASFTEYVVAAARQCPPVLEDPTVTCSAGGPYERACTGPRATIALNGSATVSDGDPIISWTHDCLGGSFNDPTLEDPVLTFDVNGCSGGCEVAITVQSSAGGAPQTCTTFVSVRDDQPPVVTCPAPLTVECSGGGARASDPLVAAWLAAATAADACTGTTISHDLPAFVPSNGCSTTRTVRWTGQDACGHSAACTSTLTIVDSQPPVVTPPADVALDCDDPPGDQSAWLASASAQDGCSGPLTVTSRLLSSSSPCPGTTTEIWEFSATDGCGRVGTATAEWTVGDATPPVVTPPPAHQIECGPSSAAEEQAWLDLATATDACQGVRPVVRTLIEVLPGCPGEQIRRWRFSADDGCGNQSEVFADLVIEDTTPPVVAAPASTTRQCPVPASGPGSEAAWRAGGSATDTCSSATVMSAELSRTPGCGATYVAVFEFWAVDECGNESARVSRSFTVEDTTPPVLVPPADATRECPAPVSGPGSEAAWRAGGSASDTCGGATVMSREVSRTPGCAATYAAVFEFWAVDACGNESARVNRAFAVEDTTPPVLVPPADALRQCPAPASGPGSEADWRAGATASDTCGAATVMSAEISRTPGCGAAYAAVFELWAVDACGNESARVSRTYAVEDTTPPVLVPPVNATRQCPAPASGAGSEAEWRATATAADTCGSATVMSVEISRSPGCGATYTAAFEFWAVDACGNESAHVVRTFAVEDSIPPLLVPPSDAAIQCPAPLAGPGSEADWLAGASASDSCGGATVMSREVSRTPGCGATHSAVYELWAVDDCGNESARVTRAYTVEDTTPPVLDPPANATRECPAPASGRGSEASWLAGASSTDTCGSSTVMSAEISRTPGCGATYVAVFELWAVDECGNESARVSRSFTVQDTTPPVLAPQADALRECPAPASGPGSEADWLATATSSDTCGGSSVMSAEISRTPGCGATYVAVFELWAADACGNESARVNRSFTVEDNTPPALSPPADASRECPAPASGPGSEADWLATATALDGCGAATVLTSEVSRTPGCGATYVAVFELRAVDACGNESAPVTRAYTVVDTTPPDAVPPPDASIECPAPDSGPGSEEAWRAAATASDTCGDATSSWREVAREAGCGRTYTATYEFWATDECGNESARASRRYVVVDTTPPAFGVAAGDQFRLSIWPPNHGYVVYETAGLVTATDGCGSTEVRATGCSSSQPEEVHQGSTADGGNGDGRFAEDCVISTDGTQFAVRAERLGACGADSARVYTVELTATDECGNAAPGQGLVVVEHDRSGKQDVGRGRKLGPNDPPPFPYVHPTVYGEGCGGR